MDAQTLRAHLSLRERLVDFVTAPGAQYPVSLVDQFDRREPLPADRWLIDAATAAGQDGFGADHERIAAWRATVFGKRA